uniref:BRCT domain-containing protein n=1 Tax=Timema genevievae TaxID=629358 RepID=A0A7R9PN38_TIMGE|nr:unnamed protein product [Timema genevievae]
MVDALSRMVEDREPVGAEKKNDLSGSDMMDRIQRGKDPVLAWANFQRVLLARNVKEVKEQFRQCEGCQKAKSAHNSKVRLHSTDVARITWEKRCDKNTTYPLPFYCTTAPKYLWSIKEQGCSGPVTAAPPFDELKKCIITNGGIVDMYKSSKTSYIVASNLPDRKVKELKVYNVVKPAWIVDMDVQSNEQILNKRWKELAEIPGIQSMHHFRAYDENNILISTSEDLMLKLNIFGKSEVEYDEEDELSSVLSLVRYSDVCIDSFDNDEEPSHKIEMNVVRPIPQGNISPGTYVLVKILSTKRKEFIYVAMCQSNVKVDGEIDVLFLKSYGESGKRFVFIDEDDKLFYKIFFIFLKNHK